MGQGTATIWERLIQISQLNQTPMVWQRRQRMTMPFNPAGQILTNWKTRSQPFLQNRRSSERKLPTFLDASPGSPRSDPTDLSMGDSVKGVDDLNQSSGGKTEIATARRRRDPKFSNRDFRPMSASNKRLKPFVIIAAESRENAVFDTLTPTKNRADCRQPRHSDA